MEKQNIKKSSLIVLLLMTAIVLVAYFVALQLESVPALSEAEYQEIAADMAEDKLLLSILLRDIYINGDAQSVIAEIDKVLKGQSDIATLDKMINIVADERALIKNLCKQILEKQKLLDRK